ncbi:MAG: M56 family metallopeptidase [Oscillospiraceae bacterium]|nr:M56 family metallopeptidase [Oscillospiraceae bacterium]
MTFGLLWEITLGSWLTAALILLVRLIFGHWLNAKAKYALWFLLMLRLLPIPLRSPTSLLRFTPEPLRTETVEVQMIPAAERFTELVVREEGEDIRAIAQTDPWVILYRLWIYGAVAVLLIYVVLYISAARRLRSLPPCDDAATMTEYLRLKQHCNPGFNPRLVRGEQGLMAGFLHPVLVIPIEIRGEGAVPILLHELMHYKFWDVWLGLLFRLFCAAYWFNPAVWFCFWLMRRDGERACDQRVLDTGLVTPKEYAKALMEEYQRCGDPDPAPMAHWGNRGMIKRISDILKYKKSRPRDRILPVVLALLILVFGVVSPWHARALYADRSIRTQVGYADAETYIQALRRTSLGSFGMTWSELVEAGYLDAAEGTWTVDLPEKRVLSVRRVIAGEEQPVFYVFRPTLYTESRGVQVLTEISVPYPSDDEDYDWKARAQSAELLEGWQTLIDCFAVYSGRYTLPLKAFSVDCWEFLYWEGRPEDMEEISGATAPRWNMDYTVRSTPVTVSGCLTNAELSALADLAVEKGWAGNRTEGKELFRSWHLAGMVLRNHGSLDPENDRGGNTLNGMGIAIYLTRPGAGES